MKGIRYVSLHEPSGYGEAARRLLLGLKEINAPLTWTPMVLGRGWGLAYEPWSGDGVGDAELDCLCNRPVDYDVLVMHLIPEYYPRWIAAETGKKLVGHTVWETDILPRHWPRILNALDLVVVPSHWNREVFERSGVTAPIRVVPHCLDPAPAPERPWPGGVGPSDFVFYTINEWNERKALWNILHVYLSTFRAEEPVVLLIKTSRKDRARARVPLTGLYLCETRNTVNRIMRRYRRPARVRLITDVLSNEEIRALHARGDCYISLCRAEGWGIGAFDAAAAGKPVIMTAFGGQREFLTDDLAWLVDYKLVPVRSNLHRTCYTSDQRWASPDLNHASRLMRHVFENAHDARARAKNLAADILRRFNREATAKLLVESLEG